MKGYADGYAYGETCASRMVLDSRITDNINHVMASPYVEKDSPTRAYWLGFVRALRARRWH